MGGNTEGGGASAVPRFVDRSGRCGIDMLHVCGGVPKDYIIETNGGGSALIDYDGDGDLDVFFVNGARFPDDPAGRDAPPPTDTLYRNEGGWRFRDVTLEAGLVETAWGGGCTIGDVDNDGDTDLFVCGLGPDQLWINDGAGRFVASGPEWGIDDDGWGASCAFLDYDRDSWIDLFVVDYLEFDRDTVKPRGPESPRYKGQPVLSGPVGLPMVYCTLYRNDGGKRFIDVSDDAGITVKKVYGLGVAIGDYDGDDWPDVYVSSDTTENLLFRNRGDGTFEEVGMQVGVARNDSAIAQAGMGVNFVFLGERDVEDIFVLNYEDDNNTFYRNDGDGFFSETTAAIGLASPCFKHLGWSNLFGDFDLDGDLDLFISQGHVVPQVDNVESSPGYRQLNKIFLNDSRGHFTDVSSRAGPGLEVRKASRGASCGDLDGDGDLDVVVNDIDDRVTVLENEGVPGRHWLGVRAVGVRSNRSAIGARIRISAGGRRQTRRVQAAAGFASASDLAVHFGLGSATGIEELRVRWPAGGEEVFPAGGVDRVVLVREGDGRPEGGESDPAGS